MVNVKLIPEIYEWKQKREQWEKASSLFGVAGNDRSCLSTAVFRSG